MGMCHRSHTAYFSRPVLCLPPFAFKHILNRYVRAATTSLPRRNNRVQVFDVARRRLLVSIGRRGQIRPGRMQGPEGVAFIAGRREVWQQGGGRLSLQLPRTTYLVLSKELCLDGALLCHRYQIDPCAARVLWVRPWA